MPKISGNSPQDPLKSITSETSEVLRSEENGGKVNDAANPALQNLGAENNLLAEKGGWGNIYWLQLSFQKVVDYIPSWSTSNEDSDDIEEEDSDVNEGEIDSSPSDIDEEQSRMQESLWSDYLSDALSAESEAEVVKTYCAAEKTLFGNLMGGIGDTFIRATSPIIKTMASSFNQFDKGGIVAEQKEKMLTQLDDPQFVEFYELTAAALLPSIREKVVSLSKGSDPMAGIISSQEEMIMNLLEVVLARGFANLAQQINENKNKIPGFESQPSLVSIISFISQRAGDSIDQQQLSDIEKKYSRDEARVKNLLTELFPDIDKHPQSKKSLELYIKEYLQTDDLKRKKQIEAALFPIRDETQEASIKELFLHLDNLHSKNNELKLLFRNVSEEVLNCLFPNKLSDIQELKGKLMNLFGGYAFNFIRDSISEILLDSYLPIEDSSARKEEWRSDLQGILGIDELDSIIEAPVALVQALSKDYIQSDPSIIGAVTTAINEILNPEEKMKEDVLSELSQQELASWMVQSVQVMLNSTDPHVTGLESFAKRSLNNLTLALMAKGAKLVIPKGTEIEPAAFIKEFSNRLIEKMEANDINPSSYEVFFNDFSADLPLPPLIRGILIPILVEKAKKLKTDVSIQTNLLSESRDHYIEAKTKIQSYENGAELLSITENVTEQLVSQALKKNLDLISTLGLGETLDELFDQYLPGIEVNEELKEWFKNNITALGMTEQEGGARTVTLLKEAIQTVFLKAMVDMIEKNFKGDSKDYAAQLLNAFHVAFSNAFEGLDKTQREQLNVALKIQAEIDKRNHELREIKDNLEEIPSGLLIEQKRLFEEALSATNRINRAQEYHDRLIDERKRALTALNDSQRVRRWSLEDLSVVSKALVLRKIQEKGFHSVKACKKDLEDKVDTLLRLNNLSDSQKKDLVSFQVLLAMLDSSPHSLKLLSELMNIQTTIDHADREVRSLEIEHMTKTQKLQNYGKGVVQNREEWNAAFNWFTEALASKWKSRKLSSEIAKLEEELDKNLKPFQKLSKELSAILGWERKEKLNLPPILEDKVWGVVTSLQDKQLARLLFYQVVPFLNSYNDIESNRARLTELSLKNPLLGQLIDVASREVISNIPDYFTSYKPFVHEVLTLLKGRKPTEEEVLRFEEAFNRQIITTGSKESFEKTRLIEYLKGRVPEGKEKEFGEVLFIYVQNWGDADLSMSAVSNLKAGFKGLGLALDDRQLERQAMLLMRSVDQFLFNIGKEKLEASDLINAYNRLVFGKESSIRSVSFNEIESRIKESQVIEKMKRVILTPEEVAQSLNDAIPGARELHALIAPQLQAVIAGNDPAFQKNRKILQDFLEGSILSLVVKVAEHNGGMDEGKDPLTVMMEKLKALVEEMPQEKGRSREDVAHQLIDKVFSDILDINSKESLEVIPPALRKLVFEKIKEKAYQELTPLLLPIIDRKEKRELLRMRSGSGFLGATCKALSIDAFSFVPGILRDNKEKIKEFIRAPAPKIDQSLVEELGNQLQNIISEDGSAYANGAAFLSTYLESVLLDVFVRVAEKNPAAPPKDSMAVLTEKLLDTVTKKYLEAKNGHNSEGFAEELNQAIMRDLLGIDSPTVFKGLPEGVQTLVYDAVKNQIGEMAYKVKESLTVLSSSDAELKRKKEEAKKFGVAENATKGYIEQLSIDVIDLVLNSALFSLAEKTGDDHRGVVSISKNIEDVVRDLARGNMEIGKVLLNYTNGDQFKGLLRDKLIEIGDPKNFVEDKELVVETVGNLLFNITNTAVEKTVAFSDKHGEAFTRKLMTRVLGISAEHLKHLNDARELAGIEGRSTIQHKDFMRAVEEIGDELHPAAPSAPAAYNETLQAIRDKLYPSMTVDEITRFKQNEEEFHHLIVQKVNDEIQGVKLLSVEEFSEELSKVFAAVIKRPLTQEEKLALNSADKKGLDLKDIMRREADAFNLQRKEKAYLPAADAILEMVFPNGKDDLDFVPEELRGTVWNLFKKNLLPVIFTVLTDVVLDPQMINTIVLKSLESANESLREDVKWQPPEPVDRSPEARALDQVSGELIAQALRASTLPKWAQNMLKDEHGNISEGIKESMGAALRAQFSETFVKDKLAIALENAVGRDEDGNPVLNFKPMSKKKKELEQVAEAQKTEKELKKVFRETVYVSIGYYFRSQWANFQHDFDELISKACGEKGNKVKHYLDRAFRVFFIEIGVNIILYWLSTPIRFALKKLMDAFIDANRESILKLLTDVPPDQPEAGIKNYALYHEDLLYKVGQALSEVVNEFINEEPILPLSVPKST